MKLRNKRTSNLTNAIGVSRSSITYYKIGRSCPKPENLSKICTYLKVNETYFWDDEVAVDDISSYLIHSTAEKKRRELKEEKIEEVFNLLRPFLYKLTLSTLSELSKLLDKLLTNC